LFHPLLVGLTQEGNGGIPERGKPRGARDKSGENLSEAVGGREKRQEFSDHHHRPLAGWGKAPAAGTWETTGKIAQGGRLNRRRGKKGSTVGFD